MDKMYKVKITKPRKPTHQYNDIETEYEFRKQQAEIIRRNRIIRNRNRNRLTAIALTVFTCVVLVAVIITTISMINHEPRSTIIEAEIPSGEFIIERAYYCALCSEIPDVSSCEACLYEDEILEV